MPREIEKNHWGGLSFFNHNTTAKYLAAPARIFRVGFVENCLNDCFVTLVMDGFLGGGELLLIKWKIDASTGSVWQIDICQWLN